MFTKEQSKAFTITPNDGYHVDSLTVDGTAVDVVTEYNILRRNSKPYDCSNICKRCNDSCKGKSACSNQYSK